MHIAYFGVAQSDAFVPALVWLLVATVLAVTPVVVAPLLRRRPGGRRLLTATAVVLAVLAVVPGVLQVAAGVGALDSQRATVRRALADRYGLTVTDDEAQRLIDGATLDLPSGGSPQAIHLAESAPGSYRPVQAGAGPLLAR